MRSPRKTPTAKRPRLATRANRHHWYERSVQTPDLDAVFMDRTFYRLRGRRARVLREDFCGTAALCAEWVKLHADNRAYGIDLDEKTLNWGIREHLVPLGERAARVVLMQRDVRQATSFKPDVAAAFNFSYFTFKDRPALRGYLESVHRGLARDGILFMDIFGGCESMDLREERTVHKDFTYVWDQDAFNPITHEIKCHIHFEFPDGSAIRRAFTYDWRLWQIPEVGELAREAGFKDFAVYWEGTDHKTSEGNGIFRPSKKGDDSPAFIAYLLCIK